MGETFRGRNNLSPKEFKASLSQGSLMKKRHLAILLSQLKPNPKPKLRWESYTIDAESAAEIAYTAFLNGDIEGVTEVIPTISGLKDFSSLLRSSNV